MEFTGEVTRADGSTETFHAESDLYFMIGSAVNAWLRSMEQGDAITINRTK